MHVGHPSDRLHIKKMKWAFLFLACLAAFDGALIGLLFKGVRRRALWMAAASVAGMTLALSMFQFERNDGARGLLEELVNCLDCQSASGVPCRDAAFANCGAV